MNLGGTTSNVLRLDAIPSQFFPLELLNNAMARQIEWFMRRRHEASRENGAWMGDLVDFLTARLAGTGFKLAQEYARWPLD